MSLYSTPTIEPSAELEINAVRHIIRGSLVCLAALALALFGAATAQSGGGDPAQLCADAGGVWDPDSQTCFNVICGFDDEAKPICDWMAANAPGGTPSDDGSAPPAPPAPSTDTAPDFTG